MIKLTLNLFFILSFSNLNAALTQTDIDEKMKKTASELGISVYEELPLAVSTSDIKEELSQDCAKTDNGNGDINYFGKGLPLDIKPQTMSIIVVPEDLTFKEKMSVYYNTVATVFRALFSQIADSLSSDVPSFEKISENILKRTYSKEYPPRPYGDKSLFMESGFIKEFEQLVKNDFTDGNNIKFLIDGPESFKYKDYLIKNAKKKIYIATWAFYDDITGKDAMNMLIEKKKEGVDIKIIVDKNVSGNHGVSVLKKMQENGIEILKYKDDRFNDIWHVKIILVDDQYLITGGMNFGDPYSHKDPNGLKWRDTDVLITGPALSKAINFFTNVWNSEISDKSLNLNKIAPYEVYAEKQGNARVSFSYSNPPSENGSDILAAIIKSIDGATKKINIENAYFVPIPALTQAILKARERKIEVNLLTNSKDSIDSEARSLSDVSMKSLLPLLKAGVNIYLKKGETLHSKFITVDGIFCSIGSYNLHPRGERYDTEFNAHIIDNESVSYLDKVYEKDILLAQKITDEKQLTVEQSWFSKIIEKYFYSQLKK